MSVYPTITVRAEVFFKMRDEAIERCPFHGEHLKQHQARRNAIALNGSFFNSQRMLQQYLLRAYV